MAATTDGDERVMAAAQQILKSLGTRKDDTEDMIFILSSFDNRLSAITDLLSKSGGAAGLSRNEERLEAAEKIVRRWDSKSDTPHHHCSPWEDSPDEAAEYLFAVDEILRLTEDLTLTSDGGVMDRAESVLQLAMSRLEDEFRHILIRNTVPLDAGRLYGLIRRLSLSFTSNDGDVDDIENSVEEEHESFSEGRGGSFGDNLCVDLVNPDAIADLKEIADRMIRSRYEKECCQVYSSVRRDVLQECLSILGIEKLSIEEVQKIEWRFLDEKMKKWIHAVKIVIRVLFPGEKRLCEQVFGDSELIRDVCFTEGAKGCMMQLLNFGEAIAIGQRSPERLSRILDMYEALSVALPELQVLFSDDSGDFVYGEAHGILARLGEAAKGAFAELQNAVQSEASRKQKPNQGEIHPVTRYVMNYMKLLVDYSDSLNQLLEDSVDGVEGGDNNLQLPSMSPVGRRLLSLISSLESNLEEKSKLYEDSAMQNIFLMNNILYIVQKVKDSELGKLLGDQWVRKRRGQIRQYSTGYLRASWSKVLSCLKDEGIGGGGSSSNVSKPALKERFKNFNLCFEEIYRTQTAWKVPDPQLREELRILISEKVIPAYRAFLGRFGNHLDSGRNAGKYIKYTPEDLEDYLLDLFEGSPGVIHNPRRKIST
ncbi:exocyst complex component EXO70B1-like [Telopea speciosissima]|uniref:exocyst complex component EXO70B1-like n=1 Tax=Telopea speciosissima TaxID=54955 RepID=UPI001CC73E45|nr:exocyst complex component EXO70B1-like [Telopea speciosissima]XP_043724056.1 exocyst complex component EXO70B1-like [Telopea speciosissima]